jgi:hypothetical protein
MSTKITNLTNEAGETVATVSFDESAHSWRIASKGEPNFQRTFSREPEAFYFWYSRFDPHTGKLRRFPPESHPESFDLVGQVEQTATPPLPIADLSNPRNCQYLLMHLVVGTGK